MMMMMKMVTLMQSFSMRTYQLVSDERVSRGRVVEAMSDGRVGRGRVSVLFKVTSSLPVEPCCHSESDRSLSCDLSV